MNAAVYCRLGLVTGIVSLVITAGPVSARAQAPDAEQMFRSLDTNGDGRLTLEEANPNSRAILQTVFQMGGKQPGESMSRAEFQQVFDRHRAGNGAGTPNPAIPPTGMPAGRRPTTPQGSPLPSSPSGNPATPTVETPAGSSDAPGFFQLIDTDKNGKLSRSEFARLTQFFARLDKDKDGSLDWDELQTAEPASNGPGSGPAASAGAATGTGPGRTRSSGTPTSGTTPSGAAAAGPTVWRGWVVNGAGENPNAGQMEMELTIAGNVMRGRELGTNRAPQGLGAGTFQMTGDGQSGNLDALCTEGQNQGRNYLGIFQMEGDTLRWCVSGREGQRPAAMATDRGNYLLILRRVGA